MRYGYIYKTTNLINGKIYIGKHMGEFDYKYFGSGKSLILSIMKYGWKSFKVELVTYASDKNELDRLEIHHISEMRKILSRRRLYNISDGGDGGPLRLGKIFSKKSLDLMRESAMKHRSDCRCAACRSKRGESPWIGRKHTEGELRSISAGNSVKTMSDDARRKMREAWVIRRQRKTL